MVLKAQQTSELFFKALQALNRSRTRNVLSPEKVSGSSCLRDDDCSPVARVVQCLTSRSVSLSGRVPAVLAFSAGLAVREGVLPRSLFTSSCESFSDSGSLSWRPSSVLLFDASFALCAQRLAALLSSHLPMGARAPGKAGKSPRRGRPASRSLFLFSIRVWLLLCLLLVFASHPVSVQGRTPRGLARRSLQDTASLPGTQGSGQALRLCPRFSVSSRVSLRPLDRTERSSRPTGCESHTRRLASRGGRTPELASRCCALDHGEVGCTLSSLAVADAPQTLRQAAVGCRSRLKRLVKRWCIGVSPSFLLTTSTVALSPSSFSSRLLAAAGPLHHCFPRSESLFGFHSPHSNGFAANTSLRDGLPQEPLSLSPLFTSTQRSLLAPASGREGRVGDTGVSPKRISSFNLGSASTRKQPRSPRTSASGFQSDTFRRRRPSFETTAPLSSSSLFSAARVPSPLSFASFSHLSFPSLRSSSLSSSSLSCSLSVSLGHCSSSPSSSLLSSSRASSSLSSSLSSSSSSPSSPSRPSLSLSEVDALAAESREREAIRQAALERDAALSSTASLLSSLEKVKELTGAKSTAVPICVSQSGQVKPLSSVSKDPLRRREAVPVGEASSAATERAEVSTRDEGSSEPARSFAGEEGPSAQEDALSEESETFSSRERTGFSRRGHAMAKGEESPLSPQSPGWNVVPESEWQLYSRDHFFHQNQTANYELFPDTLPLALTSQKLKHLQTRQREVFQTRKATERRPGAKTWRDYLSWLPEDRREDSEGFPPSPETRIEDLPVKTLVVDNETILYRQACAESPMIVDDETFNRLKAKWRDQTELQRIQKEEKGLYDVPEEFPDDDWVPVKPDLPMGRLVVDYGLIPNVTLTAGGFDYIETYHDPARNYTWSYKRWNPFKQEGELPGTRDNQTGSAFSLETEESRRYWGEEASPPKKELDDGVFRQVTLAEQMTAGMKRTPVGMDQWQFTPLHPLGHVAREQNFSLSASNRTLSRAREESQKEASVAASLAQVYAAASEEATCVEGQETLPLWIVFPPNTNSTSASAFLRGAHPSTSSRGRNGNAWREAAPPLRSHLDPLADLSSCPTTSSSNSSAAFVAAETVSSAASVASQSKSPTVPLSSFSKLPRLRRSAYQPLGETPGSPGERGDEMTYRQLGKSDLFVSQVGLGTMTVGSPQLGRERAFELFDYAVDEWGVNFFDTAELYPLPASPVTYGRSEEILGAWLARRGRGEREKFVVATKVAGRSKHLAWLRTESTKHTGASQTQKLLPRHDDREKTGTCLSKKQILAAAEGSLRRLKTDYVDLFQLHWPERYVPLHSSGDFGDVLFDPERAREQESREAVVPMEEQLEAVGQLLREGKIRAWGLSNETPYGVCRFTELATRLFGLPPPASVQVQYNLLCRNDVEKGFVELARPQNAGTALLAYGALGGGILTGKYLEWLEYPTTGRMLRFPSYMKRYRGSLAARAVSAYFYLALRLEHPNLTVMALRWVLSRPFICSTILGFTDFYQLRENLFCTTPACGALSDWAEREINFLHWKWRDVLRIIQ
ncbi:UNVERIFIED_CONTAM: aldo-keto reductase [Hammondia hammondi]|eukprot:XP_008886887.1 aldo-keto reductase [Hammondia hammondi]